MDEGRPVESLKNGRVVVFETSGGGPFGVNSLERDESSKGETIKIDWVSIGTVSVGA